MLPLPSWVRDGNTLALSLACGRGTAPEMHAAPSLTLLCGVTAGGWAPAGSSTQFLNHFSALSEEKLAAVSKDISRLEKVLVLLETKLNRPDADSDGPIAAGAGAGAAAGVGAGGGAGGAAASIDSASLPSLPAVSAPSMVSAPAGDAASYGGGSADMPAPPPVVAPPPPQPAAAAAAELDPEYEPFRKMLKVRVPSFVVAHKMRQAGLDPTLLNIE